MNVLSLFDGMSCGQLALQKSGVEFYNYYASEIDKNAIQITQKNFPETVQLGDVSILNPKDLNIDLLIGGSPCQGFSIAGKKLNFEDQRSKLFFEYVRILKKLRDYNPMLLFLLENVRMPNNIANAIDDFLGVKRVFIDSRDFTGMIRKRFYWTNIDIDSYSAKDIKIKDLIDANPFDRDLNFLFDRTIYAPAESRDGIITLNPRDITGKQTWQRGRVYDVNGNCPTICASLFDLNISEDHKTYRKLTINECERLQGVPKNYTEGISIAERGKLLGNGWTVDVIAHIFKNII